MNDNVLAVLMHIFENHIKDERQMPTNEAGMFSDLVEAGFEEDTIMRAFEWLSTIFSLQEAETEAFETSEQAFRVFSTEECYLFDKETQGTLLYLEQAGILDAITRERVINRMLAAEAEQIDGSYVKLITMLVLLSEQQEDSLNSMEQLMQSEHGTGLH